MRTRLLVSLAWIVAAVADATAQNSFQPPAPAIVSQGPDTSSIPNDAFPQMVLFGNGDGGYASFRLPSLIRSNQGTLLGFAEARKYKPDLVHPQFNDSRKIDLVLRRSVNGGQSWLPLQVIMANGQNTCSNPCSVVDRTTGTIFLLWSMILGTDNEGMIRDGKSKGTRTVWVTKSTDEGKTWSPSYNITPTAKAANWSLYATGPGTGIQTSSGRLIIPCDHAVAHVNMDHGTYQSHVIYSDDHGATWHLGGTVGPNTNECQLVQLRDGALMISMRNLIRKPMGLDQARPDFFRLRAVSYSRDEGMHWSRIQLDPQLPDPGCEASLIRFSLGGSSPGVLFFSNPDDSYNRIDLSVRVSATEGKTWRPGVQLCEGVSGYSSLCQISPQTLGVLYERPGGLTFCQVPASAILSTLPRWEAPLAAGAPAGPY